MPGGPTQTRQDDVARLCQLLSSDRETVLQRQEGTDLPAWVLARLEASGFALHDTIIYRYDVRA